MKLDVYVENNPIDHLSKAVDDLVTYLGRSTDAEISVKKLPVDDGDAGLWIGRTPAHNRFQDRINELNHDGYLLWGNGSKIVICGKTPDGTANGIYSFLRRFLGVRWFAPGPLFEFVPKLKDFRLPKAEEISNPTFALRMYSGVPGNEGADWYRRNLLDRSRPELPYAALGHNLFNIFPPSEFARDRPEIYALIDGKRMTDQTSFRGQPCFSSTAAAEIAVEKIRKFFDSNPTTTTFSLSINDNIDFCQCDECVKFGIRRFRERPIHSNAYFHFVDRVARDVLQTHPDKYLAVLAYWGVELPPENIPKLPSNVAIVLTQDTSQHYDPDYREEDRAILSEWSRKCDHLVKYDYYGLGWLTPRYFPGIAAEDLVFLNESKGVGFYCEVHPFWPNIAPQLYMAAHKQWNVKREYRELLDEFFAFFSPVSEEISSFYNILEEAWLRERPGRWFEGFCNIPEELKVMSLEDANGAWDLLSHAYEASSGNCRKRVQFLMGGFELSYQLIRGYHMGLELRFLPVSEDSDLEGALDLVMKLQNCIARAATVHKERILTDGIYPTVYFKDPRFERKFLTWTDMLNCSCLGWLETAHRYLQEEPDRWKELLRELPKTLAEDAALIIGPLKSRNLLEDPGFEETRQPPAPQSEGIQIGRWLSFHKDSDCAIDHSFAHSGTSSLRLESRGWNRVFILIPVKLGRRYLVEARGYADGLERKRQPRMDITFMEKPEDSPGKFAASDLLQTSGEWQKLLALVRAPAKGDLMGIHFILDNPRERVWIDDISIRETD